MVVIRVNPDFDSVFLSAEARRINYDEVFKVLLAHYEDKTPQVQTLRNLVNEWFVDNTLGKENKLWGIVRQEELWMSVPEIMDYFGLKKAVAEDLIGSSKAEYLEDGDNKKIRIYELGSELYSLLDEAGSLKQLGRIRNFVNTPVPFGQMVPVGLSKRVAGILKDAKNGRMSLDEILHVLQYTYEKRTDAEVVAVKKIALGWLDQNTQVKYRRLWDIVNKQLWLTPEEVQQHFGVDAKTAGKFLDESQAVVDEYPETPVTYYKIDEKKYEELSTYKNKKQTEPAPSSAEKVLPEAPKIKRERRKAGEGRPECFSLARIVEDYGIEESEALRILKDAGTIDLTSQECPLLYKISPEITAQLQNAPKKPAVNSAESSKPEYANKPERQNQDSLPKIVRMPEKPSKVVQLPVKYPGVVETAEGFDITALFETMPPQLREIVLHKDYVAREEGEKVIVETDCFGEFMDFYTTEKSKSEGRVVNEPKRPEVRKPNLSLVRKKETPLPQNSMDRGGLELYIASQISLVREIPAGKVESISAIVLSEILHSLNGKPLEQYSRTEVEEAVGQWKEIARRGFGGTTSRSNIKNYADSSAFPVLKTRNDALEFASGWVREQGVDGDQVVYVANVGEISEIVELAKARGKNEYNPQIIALLLRRRINRFVPEKAERKRGRKPKEAEEPLPLDDEDLKILNAREPTDKEVDSIDDLNGE